MIKLDIHEDTALVTGDAEELYLQLELLIVNYAVFQPKMLVEALQQLNSMIADGTIHQLAKEMKESTEIEVHERKSMKC